MPIELQQAAFMPSGIPAGSELAPAFRQSLEHLAGVPLALQPVVEDGTYDEIKACIFRVLSYRICDVAMEDITDECRAQGIKCQFQRREWKYFQTPAPSLCTTVQMNLNMDRHDNINGFLEFLARNYNFRYNRMAVNHRQCTQSPINAAYVFLDPSIEVDAEIVWPYWT